MSATTPSSPHFLSDTFGLADKPLEAPGLLDVDGRVYELIFYRPFRSSVSGRDRNRRAGPGARTHGYGSNRQGPVGNYGMVDSGGGGTLEHRSPQDNRGYLQRETCRVVRAVVNLVMP